MKTLKRKDCAILPLVLKRKWYDLIASGEKREEYRDATEYWETRIYNWGDQAMLCAKEAVVEFRLGYAKDAPRMAFTSDEMDTIRRAWANHPEWGEPIHEHFAIPLHRQVILED